MYLPLWVNILGIIVDAVGAVLLWYVLISREWMILIAVAFCFALGIAAYLCWKNQRARILDDAHFEYTTFLGKSKVYAFSDIVALKPNADSMTLVLNNGKVHIESCVIISDRFLDKISAELQKAKNERFH